jgi:hypothetical protein
LHADRLDPASHRPVRHLLQVLRETAKALYRHRIQIRWFRHPVLLIAYIDTRGFGVHYL